MNGAHDLGGMHGFGPVVAEPDEPVFHQEWERRCFGLTLAAGFLGRWNIDMSRYARERMDPAEYLRTSYYEHWLHGLEVLLVERGLVTAEELASGRASGPRDPSLRALGPDDVLPALARGGPARMADPVAARFREGERVRVRNEHPVGHVRAPRYVRGREGVVVQDYGVFVWPDAHAADGREVPVHLYSVRFGAGELWGDAGSARDAVYVDVFEPYLEQPRGAGDE